MNLKLAGEREVISIVIIFSELEWVLVLCQEFLQIF